MSRADRQLALLKVLAAAAWADGRLDREEVNHIKELALVYGLDETRLKELDPLLTAPVSYARCEELTRDLLAGLGSDADRHEVMEGLERLFRADGRMDEREEDVLESLRGIMASLSTVDGFLNRIRGVFRSLLPERDSARAELAEFLKNSVLQHLHDVSSGEWRRTVDAAELNRYTLFGAVLGKVAATEDGIDDEELARIRGILAERFGMEPPLLDWVVQSVRAVCTADMDRQGLLSEYNRIADMDQRLQLLEAAFAVAAADGTIGPDELEELRLIANFLWIDPRDYNAVRRRWQAAIG